ncbi:MAG: hypothetical protein ACYTFG_03905 [Planctomycetota bacterium]|jgi:hypothetical protein
MVNARTIQAALVPFLLLGAILSGCIRGGDTARMATSINPPVEDYDSVPMAIDLVWSVKVDASATQMADFAARIQACSDALWTASRGQAHLGRVILVDRGAFGHVILENLNSTFAGAQLAWTQIVEGQSWEIHMGGAFPMQAWLHEIGHSEVLKDWIFQEEYSLTAGPLPCIMGAYILGSGEGEALYCDGSTCLTSRAGCWENIILETHSNWSYPRVPGPSPTVEIIIHDN